MGFFTPFFIGIVTGGLVVRLWARRDRTTAGQRNYPMNFPANPTVDGTRGDMQAEEIGIHIPPITGPTVSLRAENVTANPPLSATPLSATMASIARCHQVTDDFTLIRGMGPLYATRLRAAGIQRFMQLAELAPEQIAEIVIQGHIDQLVDIHAWVAQARRLGEIQNSGRLPSRGRQSY